MQIDSEIIDDLSRVASGAVGNMAGLRSEVEAQMRQQFERILSQMDVVSREEYEAVREMAVAARAAQTSLEARVASLEAALARVAPEPPSAGGSGGTAAVA